MKPTIITVREKGIEDSEIYSPIPGVTISKKRFRYEFWQPRYIPLSVRDNDGKHKHKHKYKRDFYADKNGFVGPVYEEQVAPGSSITLYLQSEKTVALATQRVEEEVERKRYKKGLQIINHSKQLYSDFYKIKQFTRMVQLEKIILNKIK